MSKLLKKIFQNGSTRVLVLLFGVLLILIGYFLTHSYYVQLGIHKKKILSTLNAVVNTASSQIDGNQLDYLLSTHNKKDAFKTNDQNGVYFLLHKELKRVKNINNLKSDVYTLTIDKDSTCFLFGISSSEEPYFRHKYKEFPKELVKNYKKGGVLDVYEDENGHWISAFAPIKNTKGKIVGIVQADSRFDEFLVEVRKEIFLNIGISLGITIVLLFFLIRSIRTILLKEDELNASLMQSNLALEEKNQETLDSINYAKKIQEAILPNPARMQEILPESFIFYKPRDIVSGDFYWFKKARGKTFIACVDCTGHGVPGAFMSMIGNILLEEIIIKKQIDSAGEVLNQLHKGVVVALKQETSSKASNDGMDIALCILDENKREIDFAGAFRPLIQIRNGEVIRTKSDAVPIGGFKKEKPDFSCQKIEILPNDSFYIFTDGYADQFGGENNKKYMTKRFRDLLLKISKKEMRTQGELLHKELDRWTGSNNQVDDILVIGFKVF